jgi:hypothetical protein
MGVSRTLQRLRRIRDIEEEQYRLKLESALGELHTLERARDSAGARERAGRQLVGASLESGEVADRQAGLVEAAAGKECGRVLARRIVTSEAQANRLREEFLTKRVERRQAETLIEEEKAMEEVESGRRNQRNLDDWFGSRKQREENGPESR